MSKPERSPLNSEFPPQRDTFVLFLVLDDIVDEPLITIAPFKFCTVVSILIRQSYRCHSERPVHYDITDATKELTYGELLRSLPLRF